MVAHAKSPELPKRFQQNTEKPGEEGVARSVITLGSFLSLADGDMAGWYQKGLSLSVLRRG